MLAVAGLVADDALDTRRLDCLLDLNGFIHRERHGRLVSDQTRGLDTDADEIQPHCGLSAEAKNIRLNLSRQRRVAREMGIGRSTLSKIAG